VRKLEAGLNLKQDAKSLQLSAESASSYFLSSVKTEVAHFSRYQEINPVLLIRIRDPVPF
jgi:hypothetical protein